MKKPYEKPQVNVIEFEIDENIAISPSGDGPDLLDCYNTDF